MKKISVALFAGRSESPHIHDSRPFPSSFGDYNAVFIKGSGYCTPRALNGIS